MKEISAACGVTRTAGTRVRRDFERRVGLLASGLRAMMPAARPCELAEMIVAAAAVGGALARMDRARLTRHVRAIVERV